MSTKLLESEIARFLQSDAAEVLCVRGRWGVGKTFAWMRYLDAALAAHRLRGVENYAYVSLFGLNSLSELRYSVFESTVSADRFRSGPDVNSLDALLGKGLDLFRKSRPFFDSLAGLMGRKDAGEALARASFLLVRNQLVCFDDLERAGDGLKQRDVLGLASFLKEQRRCKVVLLLNDEAMAAGERTEFDRQLEKVVDVNLRFDPTPAEASLIALGGGDEMSSRLRPLVERLGIVNIRVIKKVERAARMLEDIVAACAQTVREQVTQTVVLATCSALQPGAMPTLPFLRGYSSIAMALRSQREPSSEPQEAWGRLLRDYGFGNADALDQAVIDGVERGTFDAPEILEAARKLEAVTAENGRIDTFSEAWDRYHGDLDATDDEILHGIYRGAMENLSRISPLNLNASVRLLREQGNATWADDVIAAYVKLHAADRDVLDLSRDPVMSGERIDTWLASAFADALDAIVDDRDPRSVFDAILERQGWSREDERLLARLSAEEWRDLFRARKGKRLSASIEFARRLGSHGSGDGRTIGDAVDQALRLVAAESPLRARRMERFGIRLGGEEGRPMAEV